MATLSLPRPSVQLERKEGQRSRLEYYEPNGRKPDNHHRDNDDPDEHSQPRTHALNAVCAGLYQPRIWLANGLLWLNAGHLRWPPPVTADGPQ
jgi:hypothetical protein